MNKLYPFLFIIGIITAFVLITAKKPTSIVYNTNSENSDLIIYWGDGCPHCEVVKKFISDNKSDQKVKIAWKEVYKDTNNQKELTNLVQTKCPEINSKEGIGVPMAYDVKENKCYSGSPPIIDWIKSKTQ